MPRRIFCAIMLFLLVISTLTLAFEIQSVKADDGTIHINSDGSITPSTTPISTVDHVTYTLTGNINDSIIVQKANSVIDGNGYTIQGPGSGFGDGIFLYSINNVTIKNTDITGFDCGIYLYSSNNTVMGNNVTANNAGIGLCYSYKTLSGNSITRNSVGISSNFSSSNTVSGNNINENNDSVILAYCFDNVFYHNNFINNIQQATLYGSSQNFWDEGCEGNYWSDYKAKYPSGVEIDSSGIMNPPYVVDANNTDRYPLMNVYWNPCDINHDLKVDMKDIGAAARAFNTVSGDILWNPHADITGPRHLVPDNKVDMRDIGLIARHFEEHL
jgi:parallel beta-helix repeat protein